MKNLPQNRRLQPARTLRVFRITPGPRQPLSLLFSRAQGQRRAPQTRLRVKRRYKTKGPSKST